VSEVQRYLFIKTVTSAATGVLCGLWCVVMDLPNAALWGVTAFALNFIPVFGSVIAAVPPLLAGFLQGGASTSLAVLGGYLVINNVIGNFIEPKVMGRAAGLSALVVVVSIVVWGWIFGPVGALLSVPLTMIAKIVFANVDDTQWLAVLLAPGGGKDEEEYVEARRRSRLERFPAVPPAHAPGPAE
jgi:predicted PurR-regulated permease PerM